MHWAQPAPHSHARTQSSTRAATAHATISSAPGVTASRTAARLETRRMAQVSRKPAAAEQASRPTTEKKKASAAASAPRQPAMTPSAHSGTAATLCMSR